MSISVIVVSKGTAFGFLSGRGLLEERGQRPLPEGYEEQLHRSHHRHLQTQEELTRALEELGWEYEIVDRKGFSGSQGHDLVISLGGDGTVLAASHKTIGVPLLGINSDPERSTGYFCATTAGGIRPTLRAFEERSLEPFELLRLRVEINGEEVGPPALNDVLIANANPAATSSYDLICGRRIERQKSSGIWISTPAGSTAGIRSAGGVVLPLSVPQLQYLVREPVFWPGQQYELLRGVRDMDEGIKVVSYMADGCAYIDGPFEQIPLPMGVTLRVSAHEPLTLLGLEPEKRER